MAELTGPNSPAVGFLLALTIGFLVGRTREPGPHDTPRPGMRDFLIIALLGAVAGHLGNAAIAIALFAGTIGAILVMRAEHPERNGITTELAAVATFVLGALCLTSDRPFGAGLGIVLAAILAERDQLRSFVRDAISDREFIDTLSFLALIFIIYPLLPAGSYGPFGFFRPREIWLFVILVSGVSYVGYFLTKFAGNERGALLTAIVGAIASTTAYTTGISQAVAESPKSAVPAARYAIISNSILFPRTLVIVVVISPMLAVAAAPAFAAMTLAGLAAALVLAPATVKKSAVSDSTFRNPFSIRPALEFGVVFTIVLLLTRVAKHYAGYGGQMVVSAISGLVDVTAISVTLASFVQSGTSAARDAVIGLTLAHAVNAIFKSVVAQTSHQPAFYLRLMAGFVIMFAVGAAAIVIVDPARVTEVVSHLQMN
ncbi:MgtC/SapB family protein [Candidatus Binatus sp.]|uniref:MgtC/SapB family protein n=1 Tax=Candidatus Binatus sp. TaxID=2811406 RepID=UPI003C32416D